MSKIKDTENLGIDLDIDLDFTKDEIKIPIEGTEEKVVKLNKKITEVKTDILISCLKNEIVNVKFLPRETGMVSNPKHIFYGGMAENAIKYFTVPILESGGSYVNVLTNQEKAYLEDIMGLEKNALSVYLKGDNLFNLDIPDDYIKYKVLLANKDFIAPSIFVLKDKPKMTYQYVVVSEGDSNKSNLQDLNYSMKSYMLLGKLQDEKETLRYIVEVLEGRPVATTTTLEFLQSRIQKFILADAKLFVKIAEDPTLSTRVLLRECVDSGIIRRRGDFLYNAEDNSPLCLVGEDPTLDIASIFINLPRNQQLKLTFEAKLKKNKD